MATLDDARQLVTDPAYKAMGSSTDDPVTMRAGAIVAKLLELGAEDETAARVLVSQAAELEGGRTGIEHEQGGLRPSGPQQRARFWLLMPRRAMRVN